MACLQNGLTFGILFGSYDFFRAPSEHGGLGMALVPGAAMAAFPGAPPPTSLIPPTDQELPLGTDSDRGSDSDSDSGAIPLCAHFRQR